jgi:hypothetical protein
MRTSYKFIVAISIIGIITMFSACSSPFKGRVVETSFYSYYNYELSIQSSAPIYNLTLYLPLPIQNGIPKIGTLLLTGETFVKNPPNRSYIHGPLPPNSHFAIEDVNGIPYLKITADAIIPDQEYDFHYGESIDTPAYTYLVNTRYPLGNESVFLPKYNLSEYVHLPAQLNYTTLIYADYQMEGEGTVVIWDMLSASNSWYLTSDASIGNHYADNIDLQLYENQSGWRKVKGSMAIGTGRYLD